MATNLNRYTNKAQEAVIRAQALAEELNHSQVEPEHLLQALLEQKDGVVPQILLKLQASPADVSTELQKHLAGKAKAVLAIGTCASYGGIPASGPNVTGIKSVSAVTGKATVNIAGCPIHPDWITWALVQLLLNKPIALDSNGRPTALFSGTVHSRCPRREGEDDGGGYGRDGRCFREVGCRGPHTTAMCPVSKWNNGVQWCIGVNVPCLGCTEPSTRLAKSASEYFIRPISEHDAVLGFGDTPHAPEKLPEF